MSWFSKCFRQGFANVGGESLKTFSGRKLAERWKEIGAELVYMDGIHQNETLFPTNLSTMAPGLEGRDLVKEFTDACRELGIRSGAYITPFEHTPFTRDHPEWCQMKTEGGLYEGPSWAPTNYWACWNSPFLDRMCALISEMFSRYPIDAAFFDGLLSRCGVCHCPSCAAKFKADTGLDLPNAHNLEDKAFREYLAWKDHSLAQACRRVVAATRVKNPNVQVVSNTPAAWCSWNAVQPVEFFDATEFACVEIFSGFMDLKMPGYIHASSVATMAYLIAYTRGQSRGYPKVQGYNYMGNVNYSLHLDVLLETRSAVAQGAVECAAGYRPALKEAFDYIKCCEPYLVDTKPVLWSAIAASQESAYVQHVENPIFGPYFEDLQGAFNALLDNRLPVEFISGRDLGEGALEPYAALILTDVGHMTDKQAEAVRRFVSNGGGLVATAQTSLLGPNGKPTGDFLLADVLGVHPAGEPDWEGVASYMQEPSKGCLCFEDEEPWWGDAVQPVVGAEADGYVADKPWLGSSKGFALTSPFQPVSAAKGAKVHAWIRPMAGGEGRLPGIVENRFGKGRSIYISPRLGEIYARYPFMLWRRLVRKAMDRVASRPAPVEVTGPLCVTAYSWEQAGQNRWVIHLINDLDETGRPRGRMAFGKNDFYGSCPRTRLISAEGIDVTVRKAGATRAHLPLEGKELPVRKIKDGLKVRIRRMDQHAMIVVE